MITYLLCICPWLMCFSSVTFSLRESNLWLHLFFSSYSGLECMKLIHSTFLFPQEFCYTMCGPWPSAPILMTSWKLSISDPSWSYWINSELINVPEDSYTYWSLSSITLKPPSLSHYLHSQAKTLCLTFLEKIAAIGKCQTLWLLY